MTTLGLNILLSGLSVFFILFIWQDASSFQIISSIPLLNKAFFIIAVFPLTSIAITTYKYYYEVVFGKVIIAYNSFITIIFGALWFKLAQFFSTSSDYVSIIPLFNLLSVRRIWTPSGMLTEAYRYLNYPTTSKETLKNLTDSEIQSIAMESTSAEILHKKLTELAIHNNDLVIKKAELALQKALNQAKQSAGSEIDASSLEQISWTALKTLFFVGVTIVSVYTIYAVMVKVDAFINKDVVSNIGKNVEGINAVQQDLKTEVDGMNTRFTKHIETLNAEAIETKTIIRNMAEKFDVLKIHVTEQSKFIAEILEISPALNIMVNVYGLKDCVKSITDMRPEVAHAAFNRLKTYYTLSFAWAGELQIRADIVGKGNIATQLPATFNPEAFAKAVAANASNVSQFITK